MTPKLVTKRENKKQFVKHLSVLPIPPLVKNSHRTGGTEPKEEPNGRNIPTLKCSNLFQAGTRDQEPLSSNVPVPFPCAGASLIAVHCE